MIIVHDLVQVLYLLKLIFDRVRKLQERSNLLLHHVDLAVLLSELLLVLLSCPVFLVYLVQHTLNCLADQGAHLRHFQVLMLCVLHFFCAQHLFHQLNLVVCS